MLDQAAAARFLLTRTGADSGAEAASAELAAELGGLPLALEQAAAYMRATGRTIPDYLGLFRDCQAELMARGDPAGYDKRVTTTWELALVELARAELTRSGLASGLLRMVACCAPEDIPLRLLLRPGPGLATTFGPDVAPLLTPLLDSPIACDERSPRCRGRRRPGNVVGLRGAATACTDGAAPGSGGTNKVAAASCALSAMTPRASASTADRGGLRHRPGADHRGLSPPAPTWPPRPARSVIGPRPVPSSSILCRR